MELKQANQLKDGDCVVVTKEKSIMVFTTVNSVLYIFVSLMVKK